MSGLLRELHVTDLGIVDDLTLLLGPGLTAITGETGAGKTLLVEALDLLLGGRADASLVRRGAAEARVEGRFERDDGSEQVLARVLPADGRSRAYVDGRLATVGELASAGAHLVELHAQHAQQRLFAAGTQRAALDRFATAPPTRSRCCGRLAAKPETSLGSSRRSAATRERGPGAGPAAVPGGGDRRRRPRRRR